MAAGTTFMETAVDKRGRAPQRRCRDAAGLPEVSSSFFAKRTSPTESADTLTPTASSRESLLSEDLDRERGWSALQPSSVPSPASLSRTVSPCSSVLSGIFSPAVVQIRKHFLAPGSSLIHTPQTCFSSSESLSSCPQSPPPRHRPPLTRLSLLTAILRKGRLPVLSPAVQRPYTPCWPVNPVTLSFCNACSAASSVTSIPLELSSQFSSTTSIDSQSHIHRCGSTAPAPSNEPPKVRPETPVKRCFEQIRSSRTPRWQQVISPPPVKPDMPLPHVCINSGAVSPPPQAHRAATKVRHRPNIFISKSFKLEPTNAQVRRPADQSALKSSSSQHFNHQTTPVCQSSKESSLSKLHMLSEKLRSPPRSPLQPSASPVLALTSPHLPPSRPAVGSGHSYRTAKISEGSQRAPSLPLSHRTHSCSPQWLPPIGSPTPTPSPAPPSRDLSLSPSPPLRSTPSPRLKSGISDYSDREGKKRKVVTQPA